MTVSYKWLQSCHTIYSAVTGTKGDSWRPYGISSKILLKLLYSNGKAPVLKLENPRKQWRCLHINFAGPYEGSLWLTVIDTATKWPEVIRMNYRRMTVEQTIDVLQSLFSRLGLLNQIVSDNRLQFTSEAYQQFRTSNGICQTLIAPYHPRSNGEAERFT